MSETVFIAGREMTLYDLSDQLENTTSEFEPQAHNIAYMTPDMSPAIVESKRGIPTGVWPQGLGWASEVTTMPTHSGTHVDAPYHYGPRGDGSKARTIDQVPLRWCMSDGVVLDFTDKPAGYGITAADVEERLRRIEYTIKEFDIVLIRTDVSKHFKNPGYENLHPGMTRGATEYLVDRGVKLIGIDAWGLDRPFGAMLADDKDSGHHFWEAHLLGREKEYCQIEKLCNLADLPRESGFSVMALPIKLGGASAGWSRVVALFEN